MTQFASTLCPQTNPSNPILLDFRSYAEGNRFSAGRLAAHWTKSRSHWNECSDGVGASPKQREHAFRVLRRLASFSG